MVFKVQGQGLGFTFQVKDARFCQGKDRLGVILQRFRVFIVLHRPAISGQVGAAGPRSSSQFPLSSA